VDGAGAEEFDSRRKELIMETVMTEQQSAARLAALEAELANFRSMMEFVHHIPDRVSLPTMDVFGQAFPLNGVLGGDHIIFIDFSRRYNLDARIATALEQGRDEVVRRLRMCRARVGILVADSAGHDMTDALLTAMLHQAFLTGVLYELETQGHVTAKLFEVLNTRFAQSSSVNKFLTMIYGEISDEGTFRFISAGHPKPLIFSAENDRLVDIDPERMKNVLPIGIFPSEGDIDEPAGEVRTPHQKKFSVNEVSLMGHGDILLLQTDGLYEHADGERPYTPQHLEAAIRRVKHLPARDIVEAIRQDMVAFAPPKDDTSLVVIKRS
jgi:serine phosphatase RsbU (regulator of sigma subunit)